MKRLLIPLTFLISCFSFAQKKYHATVFDDENNIVARGFFQTVYDSTIVIMVENMPVTLSYRDINLLKIEKNISTLQFAKMGSTLLTEVADQVTTPGPDSTSQNSFISQQTKGILLSKAGGLIQQLLDGMDDIANFSISRSLEKFNSKMKLMREYSIDDEVSVSTVPNSSKPIISLPLPTFTSSRPSKSAINQEVIYQSTPIKARPKTVIVPTQKGKSNPPKPAIYKGKL